MVGDVCGVTDIVIARAGMRGLVMDSLVIETAGDIMRGLVGGNVCGRAGPVGSIVCEPVVDGVRGSVMETAGDIVLDTGSIPLMVTGDSIYLSK